MSNTNNALKVLFNKLYNHGDLTNLVARKIDIDNISDFYKRNFENFDDFEQFIEEMRYYREILVSSNSAFAEIRKQFERKRALQPAILTECFVSQTIANLFELNEFIDVDENIEKVPKNLLKALFKAKEGSLEITAPRYIYFSNKKNIVLLQYGDSTSIDAIFVKDGYRVRLEYKEEKAKLGEFDLNYNEEGVLIPTNNILENHHDYLSIIEGFNEVTNVFDSMGNNFRIDGLLNENTIENIVTNVLDLARIDLFILQNGDKIFAVPSDYLLRCVNTNGSEIRTTGRNNYSVFTPNRLRDAINNLGGSIEGEIVTVPLQNENFVRGRGMNNITRYKLNNLFFVKFSDIHLHENEISFNINRVRQIKSSISLHINSIIDNEVLLDIYNEINS